LAQWFRPGVAFSILAWGVGIFFFVREGFDTGYGAYSGYILNVMMSALYILLIVKSDIADFSAVVAWSKMLGTAVLSVFNVMVRPDSLFLMTLLAVTLILDLFYIFVYHQRRAGAQRARPV
jgi:hypothetical protein